MGTVRKSRAPTRERLIEAAIALMRQSGLSGTGVNEIVRASGAPKGSVYHFFPDGKQQIAAEALDAYSGRVVAFIDATLSRKRSPGAKVKALFDAFAKRVEDGGFRSSCPAGTVCLDLDTEVEALRAVVAASLASYVDAIAPHFRFHDPGRARSFARLLVTAIEGAYICARAHRSGAPFREAGTWLADLARRESGA
jgi:TetR/AcrR family transcriptional repressor of lmrAB and yxaGH operons